MFDPHGDAEMSILEAPYGVDAREPMLTEAGETTAPAPDRPWTVGTNRAPRFGRISMARRSRPERRSEDDDFGGIGRRGATFFTALLFLTHPRDALKALLEALGRLRHAAVRLAMLPFRVLALKSYARHEARRPTFEDHLRRHRADDD
jgi:hypothetical protein